MMDAPVGLSRCLDCLGTAVLVGTIWTAAGEARGQERRPSVEFSRVPQDDPGGPSRLGRVEGRAAGARPGQSIVLYAHSGAWYVQPFADRRFTAIGPDGRWASETHLGTEFAALLVDPHYQPASMLAVIPDVGGGVVAVAVVPAKPVFWRTRWFRLSGVASGLLLALVLHRARVQQLRRQLHARFDERLRDRTRVAQALYDTLLQGFLGASMQLHAAVDQMVVDSPDRVRLDRVLATMGQVVREGRNVLNGLRSMEGEGEADPLEVALARVPEEITATGSGDFRVAVAGTAQRLHPIIRDELYAVGREALVNAFRHARPTAVELRIHYSSRRLKLVVRDDGCGIEAGVLEAARKGTGGVARMCLRAERVGARLRFVTRRGSGTEVELTLSAAIAFRP
jgi:signal transduction histidine kinase